MSFLDRLTTVIKGKAHDALDAVEDVGSVARQSVREIEIDIGKVEEALVGVKAERNLLETKLNNAKAKVDEYLGYAKKAVAQNNDKLAQEAIQDKQRAEADVAELQRQFDAFAPTVETLENRLADLVARRDQMNRDASLIEARSATAEATSKAANVLGGIGDGASATKTFDRLNDKVAHQEAEAAARMQLADSKHAADPSVKYASLNAGATQSVSDELAALKAQLNK